MKQHAIFNRIIILFSCSFYILLVTCLMVYVNGIYGIPGNTMVLILSMVLLQLFKLLYEHVARLGKYCLKLAIGITNCWTIDQILSSALFTSGVFSYLIMMAENEFLHIPKTIWFVIIVGLACYWSMKPMQPFVRKEKINGEKWYPTKLINAFVPRFVILYTFVVYYFIAYVKTADMNLIPSLCVVYLGVDRLITMFNTVKDYEQREYKILFRDTVKWMRRIRKMDTKA